MTYESYMSKSFSEVNFEIALNSASENTDRHLLLNNFFSKYKIRHGVGFSDKYLTEVFVPVTIIF